MTKPKGYYVTLDCRDGQHGACITCFLSMPPGAVDGAGSDSK